MVRNEAIFFLPEIDAEIAFAFGHTYASFSEGHPAMQGREGWSKTAENPRDDNSSSFSFSSLLILIRH